MRRRRTVSSLLRRYPASEGTYAAWVTPRVHVSDREDTEGGMVAEDHAKRTKADDDCGESPGKLPGGGSMWFGVIGLSYCTFFWPLTHHSDPGNPAVRMALAGVAVLSLIYGIGVRNSWWID